MKPTAVPTLRLEGVIEKSKRSEKIRRFLFEEDLDSPSSLPLSLLDGSMGNEDFFVKSEETLISSAEQDLQPSKYDQQPTTELNTTDFTDKCRNEASSSSSLNLNIKYKEKMDVNLSLEEKKEADKFIFQENVANNVGFVASTVDNYDLHFLNIQLEEIVSSLMSENNEAEILIADKKELFHKKRKLLNPEGFKLVVDFCRSLQFATEIMLYIILQD